MEGGWFSKCGSRPSSVHLRFLLQELHGWRAARFQNVDIALAPCMFVFYCKSFTDGGRLVFKMWFSP
eukprot:2534522-Pyramimonas_sp.AAC.1